MMCYIFWNMDNTIRPATRGFEESEEIEEPEIVKENKEIEEPEIF